MILHHISSDSSTAERKRFSAKSKTIIVYGIISILFGLILSSSALAGTETGEFCPTCPDWSDLNGWLAKKAAWEKEQQQKPQLQNQEIELKTQNVDPAPARTTNNSLPSQKPPVRPPVRTGKFAQVLASPLEVSADDVVLDISPHPERYIEGAVNLNFEDFFGEGWTIKPASEIAMMLGDVGISRNDPVVITGECLPCGGGPSPAAFSYWMLKYLGHDKVRLLDGGLETWEAAGLNTSEKPGFRQKTNYTPELKPGLLSAFDFVLSGGAQIVDARSPESFKISSIPKAVNIPYENLLENDIIRNETDLEEIFSNLNKEKPVVVYTNVGFEAAIVWLALDLMGYDARLYTLRDWLENQPEFKFELVEAKAKPNPIRSGESVTITATFQEKLLNQTNKSSQNGEIKLTVKGCATCGFGSPQGFANIDRKSGIVRIGSSGKTSNAIAEATENAMRCTAFIYHQDGLEVATIDLRRLSGNTYAGIWNAKVASGVYKVDIVASASGNVETFSDMLEIEVTD
jgi:thiosulfate/3-mercaptopyruvate sulfurtransferase